MSDSFDSHLPEAWTRSAFTDPAWLVAGAIAVWGVFIALDSFELADSFAILGALIAIGKLAAENNIFHRARMWNRFLIGTAVVLGLLIGDLSWTTHRARELTRKEIGRKQEEDHRFLADAAKDAQVVDLQRKLSNLQQMPEKLQGLRSDESAQAAKSNQQVSDLKIQNTELKSSIEKKDRQLVEIANRELSLKYQPRLSINTRGLKDKMFITNVGQSNVVLLNLDTGSLNVVDAVSGLSLANNGHVIPPSMGLELDLPQVDDFVIRSAGGRELWSTEGLVEFRTSDERTYRLPFRWIFRLKNGMLNDSLISPGTINEMQR